MKEKTKNNPIIKRNKTKFRKRDQELLKAIKKHGSINKAAKKLERSYSNSQKRLKKLQKEFGELVKTKKGGKKGGGTTLTKNAKNLINKYEKIHAEHQRINKTNITTIPGKVKNQKNTICEVQTPIGKIKSVTLQNHQKNEEVEVLIRENAVTIQKPKNIEPENTSARNQFKGTIKKLIPYKDLIQLKIKIKNQEITTTITKESKEKMNLRKNKEIALTFKTTATETIKTT